MKTIIKALLAPCMSVAAALVLAACGPSTLDFRNAEVVNGKIFRAGADKPYSGNLTNAPARAAIVGRKDYAAYHQTLSNVYSSLGILADIYTAVAMCNVHVEHGVLDGKAVCRATADQLLSDEMSFDKGALDGRIRTYFPRNGSKLAAEAQFDNGVLDGDMTMYGPESGRKILQMSFKQGKVHGKQEIVDDETGKLVFREGPGRRRARPLFTWHRPAGVPRQDGRRDQGRHRGKLRRLLRQAPRSPRVEDGQAAR